MDILNYNNNNICEFNIFLFIIIRKIIHYERC